MTEQAIPGCFAAATVYAQDSDVCKKCLSYCQCGPEAMQTLNRIKAVVNVDDLIAKHRKARAVSQDKIAARDKAAADAAPPGPIDTPAPSKPVARATPVEKVEFDVSEKHARIIAELPVKAQSFALTLCKTGLIHRIRKDVGDGRNPLSKTGPKWLSVALTMLINGGFTRAELKAALIEEMKWGDGTAASHSSVATKLLTSFEIAQEASERFTLSPTLNVQN